MKRRVAGMLGFLLAATAVAAQEPKVPPSTAKPGEVVPSNFRAYIVADNRFPPFVNPPVKPEDRDARDRTNKMHCLILDNGLSPVVAVFVRADAKMLGGSGVAKLAQAVERIIPDYRADRLGGFIQFLKIEGMPKSVTLTEPDGTQKVVELDAEYPDDENRDTYATEIRDLAKAVNTPNIVYALAPEKSKANDAWGLGDNDQVTVIIYNRLRVANRWTFDAAGPNDAQIAEIIAATEEMITGMKKPKK
jgi:hypothetical protein